MKKFFKQYGPLLLIVPVILVLDQVTKAIVRANIPYGSVWMPLDWLRPFLKFVYIHNTGAAFGLFQNGGLVFGTMAVLVSGFIIYYYPQIPQEEKLMRVALALQMAGALGNLIDRIRFGQVTDFVSVGNFPVFNVADSCITIGVGLLILAMWLLERKEKREQAAAEPVDEQA
ncbi:MAG: signal peptidase II [Chloroflexota bacterium]|nr:signal peptidase II [Chloroflexota bacterium]